MTKETAALTLNPQLEAFHQKLLADYAKANQTAQLGQILFVGSSLMEMFPIEAWQAESKVSYAKHIYNRAVRATTSSFLLEHFQGQILDLKPSKIFINIGSNDIGFQVPEGEFLANYDAIMSRIAQELPDCMVYVMRYHPLNTIDFGNDDDEKSLLASRSNEAFQTASDKIKLLAQKHEFNFIDVNQGLADENFVLKKELTIDGAHLNAAGYEIVLNNLEQYIKE